MALGTIDVRTLYTSFVFFTVILALSAAVVGDNAESPDAGTSRVQTILGCTGTVLALSAVGMVTALVVMIQHHVGTSRKFLNIDTVSGGRGRYY
jgi:hypothetical protein